MSFKNLVSQPMRVHVYWVSQKYCNELLGNVRNIIRTENCAATYDRKHERTPIDSKPISVVILKVHAFLYKITLFAFAKAFHFTDPVLSKIY